MVYLVTVPHTGTRFVQKILRDAGIKAKVEHTTGDKWRKLLRDDEKVLCTLRDPVLHMIGCINRGDGMHHGDFGRLAAKRRPNTHFFPVDCTEDRRAGEVAKLEAFLGCPVSTNWEKVEESPDVFGLRAKYQETGEFPERFLKDITRPIHDLFAEHGYGLPWMRT